MNLTDAVLLLLLAERIHGTDEAIRRTAKRVAKKLPRAQRNLLFNVAGSKSPSELIRHLALNLSDE